MTFDQSRNKSLVKKIVQIKTFFLKTKYFLKNNHNDWKTKIAFRIYILSTNSSIYLKWYCEDEYLSLKMKKKKIKFSVFLLYLMILCVPHLQEQLDVLVNNQRHWRTKIKFVVGEKLSCHRGVKTIRILKRSYQYYDWFTPDIKMLIQWLQFNALWTL